MKNETPSKTLSGQVLIGAAMIGLGVLFLLDNLDIFDFRGLVSFWPAVFIVFGVAKLIDANSSQGYLIGAGLIGLGTVLTLNRLDIIDFDRRMLFPLLWIGLGGFVVYKALNGRRNMGGAMKVEEGNDSVVGATAILGGFERRISTPNFRGGDATAIMGGCVLDFRGSSIEGEAVLTVFAAMGGIELKVPPDWTVVLHGIPILGGFEEKTIAPPHNQKRLIIKGYAIMGGVEVRN